MKWFANFKISVKLTISYIVLCSLMLFVGFMGINGLDIMNDQINSIYYDAMTGLGAINESRANIEGVQVYVQRMVMPEYRNQLSSLQDEVNKRTARNSAALNAYENSMTNPNDKLMFQELQKLLTVYREKRVKTVDLVKNEDYASAREVYYNELSPATLATVEHINKMSAWNEEAGKTIVQEAQGQYSSATKTMLTIIGGAIILAIVLGFFITTSIVTPLKELIIVFKKIAEGDLSNTNIDSNRKDEIGQLENAAETMVINLRNVIQNVQDSADNVAASSEELTASADQSAQAANNVATSIMSVAQGADQQVVIAGEAVYTAEKMSAEAEQIAANANIVAATSDKTAQAAARGSSEVGTAISQMASIQNTVETLAKEITGLGVRSNEIGQIVETISGIAGQTNLLALNAAIEAARAGEQGRGFAVVAEEVRKLAEQSQEAAKQISSLIGAIQNDTSKAVQAMEAGTREVKTGSELVDNAGVAFKEIAGLIEQTSAQIREISESIQQMANDSQNIVMGAQEVNRLSQDTSQQTQSVSAATEEQLASMQEIASSSQALSKRAEDLQTIVAKFII